MIVDDLRKNMICSYQDRSVFISCISYANRRNKLPYCIFTIIDNILQNKRELISPGEVKLYLNDGIPDITFLS